MYAADMAKEKQESLVDGDLEQMAQANMEERHKRLYRRKLPKQRTLKETLAEMTKAELDDVRYNLGLKGASSLKKAALVESLAEEVPRFAERWLTTVLDEEYGLFQHLLERGGCSAELRDDDLRLDYLRGIGMISCGVGEDGKLAWFLPEEIEQKLRAMDAGTYRSMAELNTETARLASGLLFYYGYLNYDQLHTMTLAYLEPAQREELPFLDFVGVMLNASCWQDTLIALPHGMKYYTLLDEEHLIDEQMKRSSIDYAKLSYSQVYDAGAPDYIEATPEYKALAQYMMQKGGLDVLKAADVVGEIYIMLQNGERIDMVREFLTEQQRDAALGAQGAYAGQPRAVTAGRSGQARFLRGGAGAQGEGRTQRSVPLRQRQEIQELLPAQGRRLKQHAVPEGVAFFFARRSGSYKP